MRGLVPPDPESSASNIEYAVVYVPRKRITRVNLFVEQFLTNNLPFSLYLGYALPNDED